MELDRRRLMKNLAAAGALLAVGPPRSAFGEEKNKAALHCALLLGHGDVDGSFERGVRAVFTRAGQTAPEVVAWKGGPLAHPAMYEDWRRRLSRATRCLAVLDDAGAAVFQELVRSSDGRLLSRGNHACSHYDAIVHRHEWVVASPAWSAGAILASRLLELGGSFRITESFLETSAIESQPLVRDIFARRTDDDWVGCVAEAVAASALGFGASPGVSAERTFVQRDDGRSVSGPIGRFVSFVVDA